MPTVSRTLMPYLPEFLYALSKSDGADQTLGTRADLYCATSAGSKTAECSGYPKYSGTAARNGEPFGELGLILQHDPGWHEQAGPPFNEMPENLGGTGSDVQKTANVLPFASQGTCDYKSESSACTATKNLSLPNGAGVNLPSGTNTPGASSLPIVISGTPGATVNYTLTEGTYSVSGTGVIGATGKFATTVDVSGWPDGTITVTATLTLNGKTTTLTTLTGKNSVAPPAPTLTAPGYANIANETAYDVTVTGQVGSIANVVITDGGVPIANQANGMDMIGTTGSVVIEVDVSALADGPITISVTLTNGAGDSSATLLTVTKDTIPGPLTASVSPSPIVNKANVSSFNISGTTGKFYPVSYSVTDGTTTISGSTTAIGNGSFYFSPSISSLKDGTITVTVTATEPSGNPTTDVFILTKDTTPPAAPTVTLNPLDDSGSSNSDYITTVTAPRINASPVAGAIVNVYVNGTLYTGQTLSPGSYTVTAIATDQAGNTSTGTAPKTLVIDTTPPTGSFGFSGSVTVNSQAAVKTQTVTLTLSLSDSHGMGTMAFSTDGTTFSTPVAYSSTATVTLPSATDGIYTVWVRATDAAGNTMTTSQTVRLDQTGPTITDSISAPTNNGSYDLGTSPTVTFSATDIDGIGSITASLDGTTTISSGGTINLYTLLAGSHTVTFTGTDKLGNTSTVTTTIQLHATLNGLVNAVNYGLGQGYISSSVKTTLLATLASAQSALAANNRTSEKSYLNTFVSQVGNKSNKITASYVTLLTSWANDLISQP